MRRLRPKEKVRVGEFRWLRGITEEVNLMRLRNHIRRVRMRLAGDLTIRRLRIKSRRRAVAAKKGV